MAELLFHKDVYIPDHAKKALHEGILSYGAHALHVASGNGEYPAIALPGSFTAANAQLVEVTLNAKTGDVEKQVWRQPIDSEWDICFPMLSGGFIKTVWLNHRSDTHKTLDRNKFLGGYQWRCLKGKLSSFATPK